MGWLGRGCFEEVTRNSVLWGNRMGRKECTIGKEGVGRCWVSVMGVFEECEEVIGKGVAP